MLDIDLPSHARRSKDKIPECATLACGLFPAEDKTQQTKEFFVSPLTACKLIDSLYQKKANTNDNFLYQKELLVGLDKYLFTKHLLVSSSWYLASSSLTPQTCIPFSLDENVTSASITRLPGTLSCLCEAFEYTILNLFFPVNLCYVNITFIAAREPRREKVFSHTHIWCASLYVPCG